VLKIYKRRKRKMLWNRERYIAHSLFEDTGREMLCELFGPLHVLEEEWRRQGASDDEIGMSAFDFDYVPVIHLAAGCGVMSGLSERVTEENADVRYSIDKYGRHTKLIKSTATIPLPLDHPICDPDGWERIRSWYTFSEKRVNKEKLKSQRKLWDEGQLSILSIPGAFDEPRQLLGEEELCIACYEEPEMLSDMMNTFTETAISVIERVGEIIPIDCVFVHEDMAGKSGPLFGPSQIEEFFKPYYSRVFDAARAYGAKLFSMDSDGDISPILDDLIGCGLNCIHPMEPVGGNDIVALRKKYGSRICFKGGIDKHALAKGKDATRAELEYRLDSSLFGGGTVFGLDHRIPNGVHIDTYRYYVNLAREILGLEPIGGKGWARMAF
jgi:hypothetical protein